LTALGHSKKKAGLRLARTEPVLSAGLKIRVSMVDSVPGHHFQVIELHAVSGITRGLSEIGSVTEPGAACVTKPEVRYLPKSAAAAQLQRPRTTRRSLPPNWFAGCALRFRA
jgi:hypothetical protein